MFRSLHNVTSYTLPPLPLTVLLQSSIDISIFIYLFLISFWLHGVSVAAHGFSLVVCGLLIAVASLVAEHRL